MRAEAQRGHSRPEGRLPLEGIRVVDFTHYWSGPLATTIMGAFGAEVIKVESPTYLDGYRLASRPLGDMTGWETSPLFNPVNLNKLGLAVDLKRDEGREIFLRLVSVSDVVVENHANHVMRSFRLTYDDLRAVKPDIIMVAMPAYPSCSKLADYVGFAFTFEHLSGGSDATGYSDEEPPFSMGAMSDPSLGYTAVFATMMALWHRNRTGQGAFIEIPQTQAFAYLMARRVVEFQLCGRTHGRMGTRHPYMAPHNVYPCRDPDTWIAITVGSDEEWGRLVEAMGRPEWALEERFATATGRKANEDELDSLIGEWTRHYSHLELMHLLQQAGVTAGAALRPQDLMSDPHLRARDFFVSLPREIVGEHEYPWIGFRLEGVAAHHRKAAPLFGQDNEYVLKELLGLSQSEIQRLAQEGIIGWAPDLNRLEQ